MKKNLLFIALLCCVCSAFMARAQFSGTMYTFAGNGTAGFSGDGGLATAAQLNNPSDVFKDAAGNVYIADRNNNRIRKVNAAGIISTIAGTGAAGYSGDGGLATSATLHFPNHVFVDAAGNIYIADENNDVIRKINTSGIISTVAGTGTAGFTGDGGIATSARLNDPTGVAVDPTGNIFISDKGNNRIRKVNTLGIISTYAGGGSGGFTTDGVPATSISLCNLNYVAVDNGGTVYLTNTSCWHFLKVTPSGQIYNVAGNVSPAFSGDCGPADSADIRLPYGIAPDNLGNIYLCPRGNYRIRRVNSLNYISTIAGTGATGYTGDGGPALSATVSSSLYGIYADLLGNIYFADQGNNVIRNFTTTPYTDTVRLCVGGTNTLTATTGSGTWTSSDVGVATIGSTTGIITGTGGGTAIITYTNLACPEIYYVTVNALPAINDTSVCVGSTVTMTSLGSGTWSSSNTAVGTVGSTTGIVTGIATGTTGITFTTAGGCYSATTVTVNPVPVAIAGTATVCPTSTITLSDATAGGTWSSGATGTATVGSTTGVVTGVAAGTAVITYATGPTCFITITVTVMPLPGAGTILGPTSLCAGATITLSDVTTGGVWSSGATGVATVSATGVVTGVAAGTAAISYAVTNSCGTATIWEGITVIRNDTSFYDRDTAACAIVGTITLPSPVGYTTYAWSTGSTASSIIVSANGSYISYATTGCSTLVDTFDVTFNPQPVVALGNDTSFCVGNTLTLSSPQPTGSSYLWSDGSTGTTITVSATGNYSLTVTNTYGCSTTDIINIVVSPIPLVNLGPDTVECSGDPITLQSSYTYTGATYSWNTGAGTAAITATVTGTYWLQVSVNGCPGADTINVSIFYDTFVLHNNDTAICKGSSVQILSSGNPAQTYQWLPTTGMATSNIGSPLIIPDTSATYIVTVHYPLCPDIVDSIHIDVQPNPSLYLGGNRSVCQYDTIHINTFVSPQWYTGYIYNWSPTTSLDNSNTATVVFTAGDTTNYIVTVSTPAGCQTIDSVEVFVHPDTFIHFDTSLYLCPGDSVQFKPTPYFGTVSSYAWHPAMYINDPTSATPWIKPITSQNYWAIATNPYGCKDTLHANIVVESGAVLFLGDSVTLYPGESYQLNPQTNCTFFEWFPPAGLSNAYISNPVASPDFDTKYILSATTEWGCKVKDSINIYVNPESLLALPNSFTPGNETNSEFKILLRGIASLHYFRIWNRWGEQVFETTDLTKGWNGMFNGKPQPMGVFIYQVEAETVTGKKFTKHGNVTLIR